MKKFESIDKDIKSGDWVYWTQKMGFRPLRFSGQIVKVDMKNKKYLIKRDNVFKLIEKPFGSVTKRKNQ